MSPALSPSELVVLTQGEADVVLFNEYSASDTTDSDKLFHSSNPCDSENELFSITSCKFAHYISRNKFLTCSGDSYPIHILPFSESLPQVVYSDLMKYLHMSRTGHQYRLSCFNHILSTFILQVVYYLSYHHHVCDAQAVTLTFFESLYFSNLSGFQVLISDMPTPKSIIILPDFMWQYLL